MSVTENKDENNFNSIITRDQCIIVLNEKLKTTNYQLLNYKIEPISATKNGFNGEHLRLKCIVSFDNKLNAVHTFFIKSKPSSNNQLGNFVEHFDCYKKETIVYQLAKNSRITQKWCTYFYSFFNNRSIVLEDLAASDFQLSKTMFNFDYDHCKVVIEALAAFHAFSIKLDFDLKSSPGGSEKTLVDVYPDLLRALMFEELDESVKWIAASNNALLYMLKRLVKHKLPWNEMEKQVKFYLDGFIRQMRPSREFYNVIIHGDIWGNNMLFKYDGDEAIDCRLVDFQAVRYSPPVIDVQLCLTINTSPNFQKQNMDKLSDYYYQQLAEQVTRICDKNVQEVLSRTQYQSSWQEYIIYSKIMAIHYKGMLSMKNSDKYLVNNEFMFCDRVKYLKDILDQEVQFKDSMTDLLEDLQVTLLKIKGSE